VKVRGQGHNQSINQSKHISIAPYVASESEAHVVDHIINQAHNLFIQMSI